MRLAHLAAGAGGMYCGSCMHDNRLAATFIEHGREVVLIPLYTPLRTDETDVSQRRVLYGGINVYLQQIAAVFRHTPRFLDRVLDFTPLLRAVGRFASSTRPEALGAMTLSVLSAERGAQRKELAKLIDAVRQLRPDLVFLPNLMFVGFARRLKANLGVPVLCGLAGEDIFLDQMSQPYRDEVFDLIEERALDVDGFVALTEYYAQHATRHFSLPPERVHRITMGICVADFGQAPALLPEPFTIGYLARICPEKGFDKLCDAFLRLRRSGRNCRLRIAGYLGSADRQYFAGVVNTLREAGLGDEAFEYVGEVTREDKIRFLHSLHALSVPATYPESKGFYVLEALAAGVPVVLPNHGSFPELIDATGGGLLCDDGDPQTLADALGRLMAEPALRDELGARGRDAVRALFTADRMATEAWRLFERFAWSTGEDGLDKPQRTPGVLAAASTGGTLPERRRC